MFLAVQLCLKIHNSWLSNTHAHTQPTNLVIVFLDCIHTDHFLTIVSSAIATVVTMAEILKNNGFAVEKSKI